MRGRWARLVVAAIVVLSALALSAPVAFAEGGSRVPENSTQVGPLKVRVFSQMCDGFGAKLHTRLNVKNTSSKPQNVLVQDSFAKVVYDPPGPIEPGKGTLVHLTSSRITPARTVMVHAEGATAPVAVAKSPCPPVTVPTIPPTDPTNPTHATQPTTPTVPPTVPITGGGGGPIGSPGVIGSPGIIGQSTGGTTAARARSSGTLPFTGSDIRAFALLGNLMMLIGFALLLITHRSPRVNGFFKRFAPKRLSLDAG